MTFETWLNHTLTYLANGILAVWYFLWSQGPLLLSLGCAVAIVVLYDRRTRRQAGERMRRYRRGQQVHASCRPYWETGGAVLLWAVASYLSAPPIPLIGGLMWLAFVVSLRFIPQERENLLFRQKVMIAGYGLIALAMRWMLSYSPDLSHLATMPPALHQTQCGASVGSQGDAAGLFDTIRDGLTPYAALVVWVMYPLGYFGMIVQRFAINRGSLLKPGGTPEDYMRDLRTRGEGRHAE